MAHFVTIKALHVIHSQKITLNIYVTEYKGKMLMDKGDNFSRVLQYQELKHTLEQDGLIRPENSNMTYIVLAFLSGFIVGSFLPW